jgi:hypothetical protein
MMIFGGGSVSVYVFDSRFAFQYISRPFYTGSTKTISPELLLLMEKKENGHSSVSAVNLSLLK